MSAAATGVAKVPQHEELFIERYNQLLKWATRLTKPDRELAQDLVQEAFLRFTLSPGNLLAIGNMDNYLYGIVRNAYLSHVRRSARQPSEQLPSFEFNAAEDLLFVDDPRHQFQVRDKLRAICYHACLRKETSITAGILLLRFFHGYAPSEVAKLLHSTRNLIDVQLCSARAEAIACLVEPVSQQSPRQKAISSSRPRNRVVQNLDLLVELREEIFATRKGRCLSSTELKRLYHSHRAMPRATVSHLVSCPQCLDQANKLLGLPLLRERDVIGVLGRTTERTAL